MNYYHLQNLIHRMMDYLNGRVNKNLMCYRYDFSFNPSNICAYEACGRIMFFLPHIVHRFKDYPFYTFKAHMLFIVIHELSHIDQLIYYNQYENDTNYRNEIEQANNNNTFSWISRNISALHKVFGEFDENALVDLSKQLNFNRFRYRVATKNELVEILIEKYLIGKNSSRYNSFGTVILAFHHNGYEEVRITVKKNRKVIDPNIIHPIVYNIRCFKTVDVINRIDGDTLVIDITSTDSERTLNEVIQRVPLR